MNPRQFFASGRVADLLLLVMAVEFAMLVATAPPGRRAARAFDLMFALVPGACLVIALRVALTGGTWPWIGLWVTAALPFHIGDLFRRRR